MTATFKGAFFATTIGGVVGFKSGLMVMHPARNNPSRNTSEPLLSSIISSLLASLNDH